MTVDSIWTCLSRVFFSVGSAGFFWHRSVCASWSASTFASQVQKSFCGKVLTLTFCFCYERDLHKKWSRQICIIIRNRKNSDKNIVTGRMVEIFLQKVHVMTVTHAWPRTPKIWSETQLENIGLISSRLWQPFRFYLAMEQDRWKIRETVTYKICIQGIVVWWPSPPLRSVKITQQMYSKINPPASPAFLVETGLVMDGLSAACFASKAKLERIMSVGRIFTSPKNIPPNPQSNNNTSTSTTTSPYPKGLGLSFSRPGAIKWCCCCCCLWWCFWPCCWYWSFFFWPWGS